MPQITTVIPLMFFLALYRRQFLFLQNWLLTCFNCFFRAALELYCLLDSLCNKVRFWHNKNLVMLTALPVSHTVMTIFMEYSILQNTPLSLRHSLVLTNRNHTSFYRSMRNSRKNCPKSKLPGSFLELKQEVTIHSHWQTQEAEQ